MPTLPSTKHDRVAQRLMYSPAVGHPERGDMQQHDDERPRPQDEPDEAPETPTDEPLPVPIQDPPAEPGVPPYVVRTRLSGQD